MIHVTGVRTKLGIQQGGREAGGIILATGARKFEDKNSHGARCLAEASKMSLVATFKQKIGHQASHWMKLTPPPPFGHPRQPDGHSTIT